MLFLNQFSFQKNKQSNNKHSTKNIFLPNFTYNDRIPRKLVNSSISFKMVYLHLHILTFVCKELSLQNNLHLPKLEQRVLTKMRPVKIQLELRLAAQVCFLPSPHPAVFFSLIQMVSIPFNILFLNTSLPH